MGRQSVLSHGEGPLERGPRDSERKNIIIDLMSQLGRGVGLSNPCPMLCWSSEYSRGACECGQRSMVGRKKSTLCLAAALTRRKVRFCQS